MKIGDPISFRPKYKDDIVHGRIAWIHPLGRFVLVEYQVMTFFGISPVMRECLQIISNKIDTRQPAQAAPAKK